MDHLNPIKIFEIGADSPFLAQWGYSPSRSSWSSLKINLAEYFQCSEDQIDTRDLYWGGPHGDENAVDGIMIDGVLSATFDRPITASDALAIAMTPGNDVEWRCGASS